MFTELNGRDYYESLRYLNLWTLEGRRNRQDLTEVFKIQRIYRDVHK